MMLVHTRNRALALAGLWLLLGAAVPAAAEEAKPISQPQELSKPGLVGEIVKCQRQDGVLSIQLRIRNTSDKEIRLDVIEGRNFAQYYVTAGAKKYLLLEDSEHVPLTPQASGSGVLSVKIGKGKSWTWWGKYPAPPPEVKSVSFYTPLAAPFDGVAVSD